MGPPDRCPPDETDRCPPDETDKCPPDETDRAQLVPPLAVTANDASVG